MPLSAPRDVLRRVARELQSRRVLPHCPECARPCCGLETLVLELDWQRLKGLWGIRTSRKDFDAALAAGRGPAEIRARDGLYYAYGRACPAYREGRCVVYESSLKPSGCTDFPVYEEDCALVADLRCEALDLGQVEEALAAGLGSRYRVRRTANPEFPFLVTFRLTQPEGGRGNRRRS